MGTTRKKHPKTLLICRTWSIISIYTSIYKCFAMLFDIFASYCNYRLSLFLRHFKDQGNLNCTSSPLLSSVKYWGWQASFEMGLNSGSDFKFLFVFQIEFINNCGNKPRWLVRPLKNLKLHFTVFSQLYLWVHSLSWFCFVESFPMLTTQRICKANFPPNYLLEGARNVTRLLLKWSQPMICLVIFDNNLCFLYQNHSPPLYVGTACTYY